MCGIPKGVQDALKHTLRESSDEIRLLNKTKSEIEKDLLDKEAAMDIDEQTARLKITAPKKRTETGRSSNRYYFYLLSIQIFHCQKTEIEPH